MKHSFYYYCGYCWGQTLKEGEYGWSVMASNCEKICRTCQHLLFHQIMGNCQCAPGLGLSFEKKKGNKCSRKLRLKNYKNKSTC